MSTTRAWYGTYEPGMIIIHLEYSPNLTKPSMYVRRSGIYGGIYYIAFDFYALSLK